MVAFDPIGNNFEFQTLSTYTHFDKFVQFSEVYLMNIQVLNEVLDIVF